MGILVTIVAVMLGCGVLLFITPKTSLPWLVVVSMFSWMKRMFAPLTAMRTGQIVATVILALATIGFGFLWMMLAVVGAFQAGHHENSAFPMVVYYSPLFITGLWIVNLIVFLRDTDISIHDAAAKGNIEAVKKHLSDDANVNAKDNDGKTPLDSAIRRKRPETADLLRKHGGKTGAELKAEGK